MFLGSSLIGPEGGHAAGRKLLKGLYETQIGGHLPEISIGPTGKPYFQDSPWHFSISHTKRHVFCVLSQKEVGLDAEEMDREVNLSLADKILSAPERREYDVAPDKRKALLTFWVLKEAQAKFTAEGIRGYPNKTVFSLSDPRVSIRDGCLVAIIEDEEKPHAL